MTDATIAFIGGSGLYDIEGFANRREIDVETPFGDPSDTIVLGRFNGADVAFLPRHGRGHRYSPTNIPVRANIYALKSLGVQRVVSVSAVGSLQEGKKPLDLVVPDQLIDRTRSRASTFFDEGIVAHVGMADPFCPDLRAALLRTANNQPVNTHDGGSYVAIEGPQFSTKAESELYRSWGAAVIGMTAQPEARLAREAEICYATLALVTDYDVWHESEEDVSVELVVANLMKNVATARSILSDLAAQVPSQRTCPCATALENAIITSPNHISRQTITRLSAIIGDYLEVSEPAGP